MKHPPSCRSDMKFEECELAILRQAVDESEKEVQAKIANSDDIKKMVNILEKFLKKKRSVCYGGTAINNILPKHAQFYNRDVEIPDYDFFSPNALKDAKELADIYFREGYNPNEYTFISISIKRIYIYRWNSLCPCKLFKNEYVYRII